MKWNRNTKLLLFWGLFFVLIAAVFGYSLMKKGNTKIENMRINIHAKNEHRKLIDEKEVKTMLSKALGYNIETIYLKDIDLKDIENAFDNDDRVDNADLYIDNQNVLNIDIHQKEPIIRIMGRKGSYYLDDKGDKIKHYKKQTIRVPIATGYIEAYNRDLLEKENPLKKVYDIGLIVSRDTFLNALVEQVYVDQNKKITIVPKVGDFKLKMEDGDDLENQFDRVKALYKNGLPYFGWNRHKDFRMDLDGQITGTLAK